MKVLAPSHRHPISGEPKHKPGTTIFREEVQRVHAEKCPPKDIQKCRGCKALNALHWGPCPECDDKTDQVLVSSPRYPDRVCSHHRALAAIHNKPKVKTKGWA